MDGVVWSSTPPGRGRTTVFRDDAVVSAILRWSVTGVDERRWIGNAGVRSAHESQRIRRVRGKIATLK